MDSSKKKPDFNQNKCAQYIKDLEWVTENLEQGEGMEKVFVFQLPFSQEAANAFKFLG